MKNRKIGALLAALALALASAPIPALAASASEARRSEPRVALRARPGTPFAAGDVLVGRRLGLADWYRGGRLLATVADPEGLLATLAAPGGEAWADRLDLRDAAGSPVTDVEDGRALFLALGPPARIFYQRGRRPNPRTVLMTYHGGYVMGASRIEAIFWGPQWATAAFAGDRIDGIDSLLAGFGGSAYAGLLKEYATAKAQATSVAYYLGHVFDPTAPPSRALSPREVIDEACRMAGDQPDPAAIYFLYTSSGLDPVEFCAYHTWWTCGSGAPIQVAYVPNLDGIRGCDIKDAVTGHSPGLAAMANATAHELAETITDPRGEGWFDAQKDYTGEIGDKCAYVFGRRPVTLADGGQWKLQTQWSNAAYLAGKGLLNRSRQAGCLQ